jgi:hypothetical protein
MTRICNVKNDQRAGHVRGTKQRGVPVSAGTTTSVIENGVLTATTEVDDRPVVRTTATVGDGIAEIARGQVRHITDIDGTLTSGLYGVRAPAGGRLRGDELRDGRS